MTEIANRQDFTTDGAPAHSAGEALSNDELDRHEDLLAGVSRTFAFTIPQLPDGLREAVTNAYLLCRIADTIEDDPGLGTDTKDEFLRLFLTTVETGRGAENISLRLSPQLASNTSPAEFRLVRESPLVLRVSRLLGPLQRRAILRCLRTMSGGMRDFDRNRDRLGLADVAELERYCYFVAGVVGEMLTELFCDFSPKIAARREDLGSRAVSFGLALQMTNILKDIWCDFENGVCWMPREVFERHGFDLDRLGSPPDARGAAFASAIQELVSLATAHLRRALEYTTFIPGIETGIRRFLIWAALLAASTLKNISTNPLFESGREVKVSRRRVATIVTASNAVIRSNFGLTALFNMAARGLPQDYDGQPSIFL